MGQWKLAVGLGILGAFTVALLVSLGVNLYRETQLSGEAQVIVGGIAGALIVAATKLLQSNGKNEKP